MDVVLCHRTADFDTLGAAVGVACLHPGTRIVLCGGTDPTVRSFLALYRDEYPIIERRAVDGSALRSLTIVDAQHRDQLATAAEWLELPHLHVAIYDHHMHLDSDIQTHHRAVEAVGAATTLIVEQLRAQDQKLSMAEATVMALGIHVDTGSLSYEGTTVRDAAALTWLMEQGANVRAIADYVTPNFPADLQESLNQALQHLQTKTVHGFTVVWVLLQTPAYVPGMSNVASQVLQLSDGDGIILGHSYQTRASGRARLTLIGRSRIDGVNLHQLLQPLGGGGHPQAAAVTLKTAEPERYLTQVVADLCDQIPPPVEAKDLMSAPVRTIRPHTTIDAARRILLRYGHSGLSVVNEQDQLVGIISRRDLDLALHHGFGHAPVKGYMTAPVRTIMPETVLPEIEALMVTYDIGRLPVLDDDQQLVGIVTRTDILRHLHQVKQPPSPAKPFVRTPIKTRLGQSLRPELRRLLDQATAVALEQGVHLYLVGGAVRDLLLAESHCLLAFREFDLVVDGLVAMPKSPPPADGTGAAVALAKALQQVYPEVQLQVYGQFQTAALLWPTESELGGFAIDIATARSEFYPYPAANPQVSASSIRQDLYRRDFTINALAVRLTPHRLRQRQGGELLDFFGGLEDLDQGVIRVLHANSFIEDPTRIFRAVKFATRLGFQIEAQTEAYIQTAIASGIYQQIQGNQAKAPALQARLRNELKYLLSEPQWMRSLQLLDNLGALSCLHPDLQLTEQWWSSSEISLRWQQIFDPEHKTIPRWLLLLERVLAQLPAPDRQQVATTLQLPEISQERLQQLDSAQAHLRTLPANACPSQVAQLLQAYASPLLLLLAGVCDSPQQALLWQYLHDWSQVKPLLNGKDLQRLGYRPGPRFKDILAAVWAATLDGQVTQDTVEAWVLAQFSV